MNPLSCLAVRRQLPAFHDSELSVEKYISVQAHLRECPRCAAEARRLRSIGDCLREAASVRDAEMGSDLSAMGASVVGRLRAERDESFPMRVGRMFEDLHLVWAALGASGATAACIALIFGIFSFTSAERPDSLSALIAAMAAPGSEANPVTLDGRRVSLPRGYDGGAAFLSAGMQAEDESMYTVAAVLSREGRITNLELLEAATRLTDRDSVMDVLNAVSAARFEPARFGGAPVAVNMVWMLTHLTVRGTADAEPAPTRGTRSSHLAWPSNVWAI